MKSILKNLLVILALGLILVNNMFSGILIGGEAFFTTSFAYESSNEINTNAYNDIVGKSTYLFLGLYPNLSDKTIQGDAEIFINTADFISLINRANSNYNLIYFGGSKVRGMNSSGDFEITGFALSPAFSLSDPMMTGTVYSYSLYSLPITKMTRFVETNYYQWLYEQDKMWKNLRNYNYELGGDSAVGVSSKIGMLDKLLNLEVYALWNIIDYNSFGGLFKLNKINVIEELLNIEGGLTAELVKYKSSKDFSYLNNYSFFDLMRRVPSQSAKPGQLLKKITTNNIETNIVIENNPNMSEDSLIAYGGYLNLGILDMINVFGQIKLLTLKGLPSDPDAGNYINGYSLYSGLYTKAIEGTIFEIDFGMLNQITNELTGFVGERNAMEVKAKGYGYLQLDEEEAFLLGFLFEGTYGTYKDTINYIKSYENITLPKSNGTNLTQLTNSIDTFNGFEVRASLWTRIFYMFYLKELVRFAYPIFSNVDIIYTPMTIESRTYLDIDLEDITEGLWATLGVRYISYNITTTSPLTNNIIKGNTAYILPYAEIKYVFGDDSFARLTFGIGELNTVLGNAYGLGFDNIRMPSIMNVTTSGLLYNNVEFNLNKNYTICFELGVRL